MSQNRTTPLSREEEAAVGARIRAGDVAARNLMVECNRGLAIILARRAAIKWDLEFDECLGACDRALMTAAERFDPAFGAKFCTYATWWIRNELNKLLTERDRERRIPKDDARLQSQVANEHGRDDAAALVTDPSQPEPVDAISTAERKAAVNEAMTTLPPRLQLVIDRRFWKGWLLVEVAEELGVSKERARQLEVQALDMLGRTLVRHAA